MSPLSRPGGLPKIMTCEAEIYKIQAPLTKSAELADPGGWSQSHTHQMSRGHTAVKHCLCW